jgi:hypothetical protein
MIPIEYLWITLIIVLGIVGAARGLNRELGVTTILLLSLFVLKFAWRQLGARGVALVGDRTSADIVMALYYIIIIGFVAIISYEGFSLAFPVRQMRGVGKGLAGLPGGLLNGYLIFGTIWDAANRANYFGLRVPLQCFNTTVAISDCVTNFHNVLVQYLPLTFVNEFVMLVLGMILLLAIVLK